MAFANRSQRNVNRNPAPASMPPREQQPGARQADGKMVSQVHQQGVQIREESSSAGRYGQFEGAAPQQLHGGEAMDAMRREQASAQGGFTARHADGSPSTGFASRA